MATVPIVTEVTAVELAALVSGSLLKTGLQYKNTDTGILYLATSTNTTSPIPNYTSYVAFLQQRKMTSGVLIVGETYCIPAKAVIDDFSNVGYVSDGVNFIATGTTPLNWTNNSLVYPITDNPLSVGVFENTVGEIVWTRESEGVYCGTLAEAFPVDKTVISPFGGTTSMLSTDCGAYYYNVSYYNSPFTDQIALFIYDNVYNSIDFDKAIGNERVLVDIRIYQQLS